MKNFKQEQYIQNRNTLRYLVSDPFLEPPSYTIEKLIKNRVFIVNKREHITSEITKLFYEFKHVGKAGFLSIDISRDHLIFAKVSYKKVKEIKTRELSEVVSLVNEVLFT